MEIVGQNAEKESECKNSVPLYQQGVPTGSQFFSRLKANLNPPIAIVENNMNTLRECDHLAFTWGCSLIELLDENSNHGQRIPKNTKLIEQRYT